MKNINILFAFCFLFLATSCDEKMVMIPEITSNDNGRVVLVEEITGVRCPNCPAGAATIEGFKQQFPGRVVSVAYHSPPFLVAPLSSSQYDFRRDEAQAIDQLIGESIGKPAAAINRVKFDTEQRTWVDFIDSWFGYLQNQFEFAPILRLAIENDYDTETRELQVKVKAIPNGNETGNLYLTVMILENHIIDPQLDQQQEIEDYEHNHVFHALITENTGGDLFAGELVEGTDIETTYSFTLPTNEEDTVPWVAENCEIVAFITNADGEVEQAAKADVIE